MATDPYQCLSIGIAEGVATLTLDHPPINLFDGTLMGEMDRAGRALEADPDVRVVVIQSDDPEFFIAHADIELILKLPARAEDAPPPDQGTKKVGLSWLRRRVRSCLRAAPQRPAGVCWFGGPLARRSSGPGCG